MKNLEHKEKLILKLLSGDDHIAAIALREVCERFKDNDAMNYSCYYKVLVSVYLERNNERVWRIANEHHISESSVYRYRHKFLNWFNFYYGKYSELLKSAA